MFNDTDLSNGFLKSALVTKLVAAFLVAGTFLILVLALVSLVNLGAPTQVPQNTIDMSGEGKVSAAPNLATVSYTAQADGSTAAAAQDAAAKIGNAALAALKDQKIADADIQTSSYNVYPRYSNSAPCPVYYANGEVPPCAQPESKIIGYTASESVTVKIHDTNAVGNVVTALGNAGISNISGPSFTVDNPDALQAQARDKAIADAKTKADALAKDLGVHIVRVVSYSEGGGGYPGPVAYGMAASSADKAATVPEIATGQNEITVDVSVTYEIR